MTCSALGAAIAGIGQQSFGKGPAGVVSTEIKRIVELTCSFGQRGRFVSSGAVAAQWLHNILLHKCQEDLDVHLGCGEEHVSLQPLEQQTMVM